MQSFFIARRLFWGKNKVVKEPIETESAKQAFDRIRRMRTWIYGGCILILMAIIAGVVASNEQPRLDGRVVFSPFPWEACGVSIDQAEAEWRPASENPRLANRPDYYDPVAYFPKARIGLEEAEGSGRIFAYFTDQHGNRQGNLIVLQYQDGAFEPRSNTEVAASDQQAEFRIEAGLKDEAELTLYQVNNNMRLWTLQLEVQPDTENSPTPLGHISVSDQPKKP